MKLFTLLIFLISCSTTDISLQKNNYIKSRWEIIENASISKWNDKHLVLKLGQPDEKYNHPVKKQYTAWIYYQKSTGFQEWAFTLNKEGNVIKVLYKPKDPYRSEFTIEKIESRWKHLNCKHEKKQKLSPGLVKLVTYINCNNGKRIIRYNMYKQVESISVEE